MTTEIKNNAEVLAQSLEANFPFIDWEIQSTSELSAIAHGSIPVSQGILEVDIWFVGINAGCLIQIGDNAAFAIASRENKTLNACLEEIKEVVNRHDSQESIN